MADQFKVAWLDHGREPKNAPNPDYPNGVDLPAVFPSRPHCKVEVPYPAARCGLYVVTCSICLTSVGITTAGRPDDPRSAMIPCVILKGRQ